MSIFIMRFFICNIYICLIVGVILIAKHLCKNVLSPAMQYHSWVLLIGLLAVPFLPIRIIDFSQVFQCIKSLGNVFYIQNGTHLLENRIDLSDINSNIGEDFVISVNSQIPPALWYIIFAGWLLGALATSFFLLKSYVKLRKIQKTALPLQNSDVQKIYLICLKEIGILKKIPIYSTAFLQSPIITGFIKPKIYIPIQMISDYHQSEIRYILLHELQHHKHKDTLISHFINLATILYWFHPAVRYALKQMRIEKEIACDTYVLNMLHPSLYVDYGNTIIKAAENMTAASFSFASYWGGSKKQIKQRILNISDYQKPALNQKIKSSLFFVALVVFLIGISPSFNIYGYYENNYNWNTSGKNIRSVDLSSFFDEYAGSFVLYDSKNDIWQIYGLEDATKRSSPDSTYKIYDALFALEEAIITSNHSMIPWDGSQYPFDEWNQNQTLSSAMKYSVNWYFQNMDKKLGRTAINKFINKISYGNKDTTGPISSYWMESTLKISPIEQVELLLKLKKNDFGFRAENIEAVKASISLSQSSDQSLYGKTGTGRVNGKDQNGWFIGFVEDGDHTYFFATHINADQNATGSKASEITMDVLFHMNIL